MLFGWPSLFFASPPRTTGPFHLGVAGIKHSCKCKSLSLSSAQLYPVGASALSDRQFALQARLLHGQLARRNVQTTPERDVGLHCRVHDPGCLEAKYVGRNWGSTAR